MLLTSDEICRYTQQINLTEIGKNGQLKLKNARVLCIGAGGLGSSLLLYLTSAGIGKLGIIDDDVVELSNLQRQVLYQHSHVGYKKAILAQQQLHALNPHTKIDTYTERVDLNNIHELITQYDIVADCSDNFATKYLVNDICFTFNKPMITASISKYSGQCSLFLGKNGPCFRCLFPFIPTNNALPNCNEGGALGMLPGLFGIIQATEIIKWILKIGNTLAGHLLTIDILKMKFQQFRLIQNPDCLLCVLKQPIESLNTPIECHTHLSHEISVNTAREKLTLNKDIILLDVRSLEERNTDNIGGLWIPLAELPFRLNELNPNKSIIVYCQSGKRSSTAAHILIDANFKSVSYLQGGIIAWNTKS